jgi:hypothetical protein
LDTVEHFTAFIYLVELEHRAKWPTNLLATDAFRISKNKRKLMETMYRRTSMSGTKKAQITFPLRHFFPPKVVK